MSEKEIWIDPKRIVRRKRVGKTTDYDDTLSFRHPYTTFYRLVPELHLPKPPERSKSHTTSDSSADTTSDSSADTTSDSSADTTSDSSSKSDKSVPRKKRPDELCLEI